MDSTEETFSVKEARGDIFKGYALKGGKLEQEGVIEWLVGLLLSFHFFDHPEGHLVPVIPVSNPGGKRGKEECIVCKDLGVLGAEIPFEWARLLIEIDDTLAHGVMFLVQKSGTSQEDGHKASRFKLRVVESHSTDNH